MFLGIDLGTSSVKTVLVDGEQRLVDEASAPLPVSRPAPRWSEQDPEDWWRAACASVAEIRSRRARDLSAVRAVGLSGQMHGATLLDARDRVLRPAILWNDGRSDAECAELERRAPRLRAITGNLAMPGFTAPKLLWVARHEPDVFRRVSRVLLPKDYLRLRMTGEAVSDMSDAAGTLWLDVGRRAWSEELLAATGLGLSQMPRLIEGSQPSAAVSAAVAGAWGLPPGTIVAGGAGDNAAGAAGVGVVHDGEAFLSLGTSGVVFVATDAFRPAPEDAVHAFCHCLPATWHQMAVLLSAASCLSWLRRATGAASEAELLGDAAVAPPRASSPPPAGSGPPPWREVLDRDPGVIFLPYLSGERTPHNDPAARGVLFGLTHETSRADLGRAVLEGVGFAVADGVDALLRAGAHLGDVAVIGGGARSALWGHLLAAILDRRLRYLAAAEVGPAFGAARLARLAATGEKPAAVCVPPPTERIVDPDPALVARYAARRPLFQALYRDLRGRFRELPQ